MIILSLLLLAAGGPEIPVAFWRSGDDDLSVRFYEQVDRSIAGHVRLRPASAADDVRFALYAESNVRPLDRGGGGFSYRVSLREGRSANGRVLARFDGKCVDAIAVCADRLVGRVAARIARLSSRER
ncbi:hypothetical protein [Sphingopyxis sp. KK2]|uniref:hypothetical protein n=1 Tax=Sphingopyxis sp. KK2 TaxID=1855727 RepID=UPI00097E6157|nr:hypothetical protein [Sphingopyxis sp. KK2]